MGGTSAAAQSGSTVIAAAIAPVRIIVVNDNGNITKIISNTPEAVTPTVRKGTPDGRQTTLTRDINKQYAVILKRAKIKKTGVIYQANDSMAAKIQRLAVKVSR
jgi:hypothetical protein